MRVFLTLIIVMFAFAASSAIAAASEDKAAFKAAYGRYNAAVEAGDTKAAVTAATEALELGLRIYPDDHLKLAALYLNKGNALLESGQAKAAIKPLKKALKITKRQIGKGYEQLEAALWAVAGAYEAAGKTSQARQTYSKISPLIKAWKPEDRLALGEANLRLANALLESGKPMLAERHLDRADEIFQELIEGPDRRTGEVLLLLGRLDLMKSGRRYADVKYFCEAAKNFRAVLEKDHPHLLISSGYIGFLSAGSSSGNSCNVASDIKPRAEDDYLPLTKPFPVYPREAVGQKLEGWVIVEFTVTKEGRVENPKVVVSDYSGLFDAAALNAARKFLYRPRLVDGVPVAVPKVRNKITFFIGR